MESVETRLQETVRAPEPDIDALTRHLAAAGGKRLRPALCLLTSFLGPNPGNEEAEISAAVVELTHLATLYHDDVMDDAPMRRGVPSAQQLAGNSAAILAGDVLFAKASALVAGLGPEAVRLHAVTFERLCFGQLRETLGTPEGVSPRDNYIHVLAEKTGSLIAASARYGVNSAGGDPEIAEAVSDFGEKVGVAFQLADDVIDIMSDGDVTGKTPGTDLREGVETMPILLLKERQAAGTINPDGQRILDLLAGERDDAEVEQSVALLRRHPVMDDVRDLARSWSDDAVASLDKIPDGEVKDGLIAFAWLMVDRIS
ncbi:polyprenyl synthetase family protein [Flaviflexus massiliensis]|uniref:polyprenyl synthetase family protein n=1 Tax=Flaviflexus massiliensis TaxID=1522309 RepID=UPI0006D598EB|nr:polyprenyl synthetase family protein [Flaviflexus massiliensis]